MLIGSASTVPVNTFVNCSKLLNLPLSPAVATYKLVSHTAACDSQVQSHQMLQDFGDRQRKATNTADYKKGFLISMK